MQKNKRMNMYPTDVHWSEVPGRDDLWKEQTIKNTSEAQFKIEFECEFLGSVDTLIAPSKLKLLVYENPITQNAGLMYMNIQENHDYVITVDVARGVVKITLPSWLLILHSSLTRLLQNIETMILNQCCSQISSMGSSKEL